jgi:hypothetical protein
LFWAAQKLIYTTELDLGSLKKYYFYLNKNVVPQMTNFNSTFKTHKIIGDLKKKILKKECTLYNHYCFELLKNSYTQQHNRAGLGILKKYYFSLNKNFVPQMTNFNSSFKTHKIIGDLNKNDWKKSALFIKEWWSGAHSIFENGSERVSALIIFLMSESWAKLKKLMSVEHVVWTPMTALDPSSYISPNLL